MIMESLELLKNLGFSDEFLSLVAKSEELTPKIKISDASKFDEVEQYSNDSNEATIDYFEAPQNLIITTF